MDRRTSSTVVVSNTGVHRSDSSLPDSTPIKTEPGNSLEERRARKREQDRLCQRRKREKDRENLRRLEARLNGLQKADDSKTVLDLILRHEQDQAKIDRQVERLRQLQSLLQAGLSDLAKDAKGSSSSADSKDADSQSPEAELRDDFGLPGVDVTSASNQSSSAGYDMYATTYTQYSGTDVLPQNTVAGVPPAYSQIDMTGRSDLTASPWMFAGTMIENACKMVQQFHGASVPTAESVDDHIILTVCLHGWDHALPFIELNHSLWACLRQVDEVVLSTWNAVARMSSLWSMWRTMKANAQGPQATATMEPKFLRPRPSQLHVAHRPDIDYFVWPGVRERLVFDPTKYYASETFLKVFSASTCFLWPFSLTDTYFEDKHTRLLQFSPEMTRRFHNLNYWSIDTAFLTEYPEFVGDIPVYNSIPPKVEERDISNQYFFFQDEENNDCPLSTTSRPASWQLAGNNFAGKAAQAQAGTHMFYDQRMRRDLLLGAPAQ